ncbi:MAG TPA: methylmalonyl-CoA mutase family protein, partial [Deltaproteobacteria bacterium]|nr:methylmalonyl-CoA mutase family protein [Deltaproteobacteria bacterium]
MKKKQTPREPLRFVTATSLFDGHDAAINIMRRILQDSGAEVIHLGHNKSVAEIVNAVVQEGAHGVAVSSYQGGHIEFFKYLIDLLKDRDCGYVKVFGGGGGVIVPDEIRELEAYGVSKIYSPEDGKSMGLKGMIAHMMGIASQVSIPEVKMDAKTLTSREPVVVGRLISAAERSRFSGDKGFEPMRAFLKSLASQSPIVGITGTGGSGKSSIIDELLRRMITHYPDKTVAVISVDPTRSRSGGALLGDRIRMNHIDDERVFMRSMATRASKDELSEAIHDTLDIVKAAGYDLIIVETSGIGQGDTAVTQVSDFSLYVMTAEFGAPTQLEKIDMLDFADMVLINKFEQEKSLDALKHVRKQYMRNHELFDRNPEDLPIFGTVASRYNDPGMDRAFAHLVDSLIDKGLVRWKKTPEPAFDPEKTHEGIVPSSRQHYLGEIARTVRAYHARTREVASRIRAVSALEDLLAEDGNAPDSRALRKRLSAARKGVPKPEMDLVDGWEKTSERYRSKSYTYSVRDKKIQVSLTRESLSGLQIPKIALPGFSDRGDLYAWLRKENLPGSFPYTAGVFPFKRDWEDPKRQFAGEGGPERTNRRFHYLCRHDEAKRLSTAFDSVTLYGEDPHEKPDIFGKIGESGVSICTLDD